MECGQSGPIGLGVVNLVVLESVSDQETVHIQRLKIMENIVQAQDLKKNFVWLKIVWLILEVMLEYEIEFDVSAGLIGLMNEKIVLNRF